MDEMIKAIAAQNKINLHRDDPYLISVTANQELMKQNQAAQQALLTTFQNTLTNMLAELEKRNQTITQNILQQVKTASQDLLTEQARTNAKHIADGIDDKLLQPLVRRMQYYAYFALIGGTLSVLSVGLSLTLLWLQLKLY